jgi:hypothetical protein
MLSNLRRAAGLIILLILTTMAAVERPKDGEAKKAEAIEALNQLDDVATKAMGLPDYVCQLVSDVLKVFAPTLIDLLVKTEKKSGLLGNSDG